MDSESIVKAISESTRFRILYILLKTNKEICSCELVDSLQVPQYNLTKHLDILMNASLVKSRKEGKWVYYSINGNTSQFGKSLYKTILKADTQNHKEDLKRFGNRLNIRKNGKCLLGIQTAKLNQT